VIELKVKGIQMATVESQFSYHVRSFARFMLLGLLLLGSNLHAQAISPAMMEQFKSLPKSQQEALAKQYGVNLDDLGLGGGKSATKLAVPGEQIDQVDFEALSYEQYLEDQKAKNEQETKGEKAELKRYGLALFDREVSTFAPTDNAQVPDDYRLGVGDELVIQLFGKDNDQLTLEVDREGQINFPKLGPVNIAGFTYEDAKKVIKQRVKDQLIGVEAVISIGRLRAINIFLAGEVKVPGAYSVSSLTTVSQALYQAGGVTDIGSLRNIQIKRNGDTVGSFDVYQLLLNGDASTDSRLRSGDVVFVPPYSRLISVEGEVKRPMKYEVTDTDSVKDAINMAGGFKSSAFKGIAVLTQQSSNNELPSVKNIALSDASQLSQTLQDGDLLRIMAVGDSLDNAVVVKGAAVRPGIYGWTQGLTVSDIFGDIRRDLLTEADLGYALIIREKNARLDIDVLQIDLASAILDKGSESDIELMARDQILVFERADVADLNKDFENQERKESLSELTKSLEKQQRLAMLAEGQREESKGQTTTLGSNEQSSSNNNDAYYQMMTKMEQEKEQEFSENSRQMLLQPVLDKLRSQARAGESVKIVSISGAVKAPGEYPLGKDYKASDLIEAAGGLKDSAFLSSAEYRRISQSKEGINSVEYLEFDLAMAMQSGGPDLGSRDHISVRETADWNPTDSITIEGEVMFPGTYLIQRGETISDVIRRAGGLTPKAFPSGAVFTRETIAEIETQRAREFAESVRRDFAASMLTEETVTASYADIEQIASSLEDFQGQGRLLVRLTAAMAGDEAADIAVIDGDKLMIPQQSNTVTVVGEVRRQGTHSFENGLQVDDYLGLSAGMTARADDSAVYIVRADGSVSIPDMSWTRFSANNSRLLPGDTIVVPVDSQHKESITLWRDITQIIYQGAVSIAAVARL